MKTYVALLRAVNLASRNRVRMSALRELLDDLGFQDPRSLLQSGNLIFKSGDRASANLESILEEAAEERLGLATHFFVRTIDEWNSIVAENPFPDEAEDDPSHLLVMLLKRAPSGGSIASLQDSITGREVVEVEGRRAYIVYPDGIGRSRLTSGSIEKKLGTSGTGRNWNTVLKIQEIAAA
jgi:uncharacterized protein (DUF1697 family)